MYKLFNLLKPVFWEQRISFKVNIYLMEYINWDGLAAKLDYKHCIQSKVYLHTNY